MTARHHNPSPPCFIFLAASPFSLLCLPPKTPTHALSTRLTHTPCLPRGALSPRISTAQLSPVPPNTKRFGDVLRDFLPGKTLALVGDSIMHNVRA